jgi:flagellar basal body-associated protein FliL
VAILKNAMHKKKAGAVGEVAEEEVALEEESTPKQKSTYGFFIYIMLILLLALLVGTCVHLWLNWEMTWEERMQAARECFPYFNQDDSEEEKSEL